MLEDAERKVMRILYNYFAQNRVMPAWAALVRKMGRDKDQLTKVLNQLSQKEYLSWDGQDTLSIRLLQNPESPQPLTDNSGSDYFMNY